ncbi:MAG: hypothetical protein IPF41_15800 [Flavobacteriales bacterium]|nr:hypothetical protein [Flavobacteriales bacterium]
MREAEAAIKSNDRTAFHGALSKALHGYLGDKLALALPKPMLCASLIGCNRMPMHRYRRRRRAHHRGV